MKVSNHLNVLVNGSFLDRSEIRFVMVMDGTERFILMCSDLTLPASDIVSIVDPENWTVC